MDSVEHIRIKLSMTVPNNDPHLDDLREAATVLRDHHFWGIEPDIRDSRKIDARKLAAIVSDNGLHISALATGRGFALDGLSLSDQNPSVRQKAIDLLQGHIDLACQLQTNVIIGLMRGIRDETDPPDDCMKRLADSLRICARYAAQRDCQIFFEAINHNETNIANTASQAASLIGVVDSPAVQLLLDTYHMDIEESSIFESLQAQAPILGHFHLADRNRCVPGTAGIGFFPIVKTLQALDYQGAMNIEIPLEPDVRTCAQQVIQHLNTMGIYSIRR
ncbi:MAG: TIM barrel protein [Actinobacteria bacterium]|nr:TIM barrel protein [Actinomycetota bacterium]